jgi:hypothetical protein
VFLTIGPMTTSRQDPSDAKRRTVAAMRLAVVAAIIVVLHLVTRFTPWLLVIIGIATALLLASRSVTGLGFLARLHRGDRLALWMVLVCLTVIGYLHDANTWSSDGKGFVRPANVAMWRTELILGVALAVPLLNTLARMLSPRREATSGRESSPVSLPCTSISRGLRSFYGVAKRAFSCNGCDSCRLGRTGGANAVCVRIGC